MVLIPNSSLQGEPLGQESSAESDSKDHTLDNHAYGRHSYMFSTRRVHKGYHQNEIGQGKHEGNHSPSNGAQEQSVLAHGHVTVTFLLGDSLHLDVVIADVPEGETAHTAVRQGDHDSRDPVSELHGEVFLLRFVWRHTGFVLIRERYNYTRDLKLLSTARCVRRGGSRGRRGVDCDMSSI